jgi:hypothetical protein
MFVSSLSGLTPKTMPQPCGQVVVSPPYSPIQIAPDRGLFDRKNFVLDATDDESP